MERLIDHWHGEGTLVVAGDGRPILWLSPSGNVADDVGIYCDPIEAFGDELADLTELAMVVGEWIYCVEREQATVAYDQIHPRLRDLVLGFAPARVQLRPLPLEAQPN